MRLLLIEDNDRLRETLSSGLRAQGYAVDTANDGLEGWRQASEAAHDLIILDRMMPGLDGLEVLRRLRTSGSSVPVLLLTARDAVEDRVAGLDHEDTKNGNGSHELRSPQRTCRGRHQKNATAGVRLPSSTAT